MESKSRIGIGATLKLAALTFSGVAGWVIADRMSAEAMAVVIGVVCGVLAVIPMSVLILLLSRRQQQQQIEAMEARQQRQQAQPSIIVVGGTTPQLPPPAAWPASRPALSATDADFTVLGED